MLRGVYPEAQERCFTPFSMTAEGFSMTDEGFRLTSEGISMTGEGISVTARRCTSRRPRARKLFEAD